MALCFFLLIGCATESHEVFEYAPWQKIDGTPTSWRLEKRSYEPRWLQANVVWLRNDSGQKIQVTGTVKWTEVAYGGVLIPQDHTFEVELEPGGTIDCLDGPPSYSEEKSWTPHNYRVSITNSKVVR